jgi:hypothetical protein
MEKKKRFGSKAKGNSFERRTSEDLSKIFGLPFSRVPNSGAFTGGLNFHRSDKLSEAQNLIFSGDIIVPQEVCHFKFECKFYNSFSCDSLFDSNKMLEGWVDQAKENVGNKQWLLIYKSNRVNPNVCFDISLLDKITSTGKKIVLGSYLVYQGKYIITLFENFFRSNKDFILDLNKDIIKELKDKKEELLLLEQQNVDITKCVQLNAVTTSGFVEEKELIGGII